MTSIAPQLDNSLPTTPSHEWAKDTLGAADIARASAAPNDTSSQPISSTPSNHPVDSAPPVPTTTNNIPHVSNTHAPTAGGAASNVTTSVTDIPGTFPGDDGQSNFTSINPIEAVKQYIPDEKQQQSILQSAGETARAYLPAGLVNAAAGYLRKHHLVSLS